MKTRPVALIIMDGYGYREESDGNAIKIANEGVVSKLYKEYPSTLLGASGLSVGLPDGQMGNSEVGHLNIGAGRIVYQELTRITKEIQDGDFFKNKELNDAIDSALKNGKKLHLYGLLSNGGVHSHIEHLFGLIDLAKMRGVKELYVHAFLDGRDVSPTSGAGFIRELQAKLDEVGIGKISSVSGRYYAMDRDNRWERVEKAYDSLTVGNGVKCENAAEAVEESYKNGVTDEFVLPTNVYENDNPVGLIEAGDSIIFFNFRPDRARELTRAFTEEEFTGFERKTGYLKPFYVCFTRYDAHVTFFFNGGVEAPNPNEDRDLIPSPKVATYDLQPEMSAYEVTDKLLGEIASDKYDVIIVNYANCDMVGHTGVLEAAVKAVKTVEDCVKKVVDAILEKGGTALITADHGNADQMVLPDGSPLTSHTTNPVPFIIVGENTKNDKLRKGGVLADIAPTLLTVMGEDIPKEMTGKSLIEE